MHREIAGSMAWITLFVLVGKLAGAFKEVAIAARFGTSELVDAYVFVMTLNAWPLAVWLSVLSGVIVPLAARMSATSEVQLSRFRAETLGLGLLVGAVLGATGWLLFPYLLSAERTGMSADASAYALEAAPVLLLQLPLGILIGLLSAWAIAANRQVNTLLEGVPALVIGLALVASTVPSLDTLVLATVVGVLAHLASLIASARMHGELAAPSLAFASAAWRTFLAGFWVLVVGHVVLGFTNVVDQLFAVRLGPGSAATLNYANKVTALIIGLGATSVSRATLPVFSKAHAQLAEGAGRSAMKWALLLFAVGLVGAAAAWPIAPWMVAILFERGAFTAQDTGAVADIIRFSVIQLPFYFSGLVLMALLNSQGRHRVVAGVAVACLALKVCGNFLLTPSLGLQGIALSTSFMYVGSTILLGLAVVAQARPRARQPA